MSPIELLARKIRDIPGFPTLALRFRYTMATVSRAIMGSPPASVWPTTPCAGTPCFVVAEALRIFHDGPAYTDIKLRLGTLKTHCVPRHRSYGHKDLPDHKYAKALTL